MLSFTPPLLTDYNVMLTLVSGTTVFSTEELSLRIPKPDSAYSIGVQAVNSAGRSEIVFPAGK